LGSLLQTEGEKQNSSDGKKEETKKQNKRNKREREEKHMMVWGGGWLSRNGELRDKLGTDVEEVEGAAGVLVVQINKVQEEVLIVDLVELKGDNHLHTKKTQKNVRNRREEEEEKEKKKKRKEKTLTERPIEFWWRTLRWKGESSTRHSI